MDTHLTAAIALIVGVYAALCWAFPFAPCRRCHGVGRIRARAGLFGHSVRDCRWCRGSGRRLRLGRRLWNALARRHQRAQVRSGAVVR